MSNRRHAASSGTVLVALLASCAGHSQPAPVTALRPSPDSIARLEAAYRAETDSARRRYTEGDVAFMTGMISHHAQALVMSGLVPDRTTNPVIRTLAARIINSQRDEIALMQQWLRERDLPVPQPDPGGMMPMMPGMSHLMPGMLTLEQMAQLRAAGGDQFDRLFLTFMMQHHSGALTMVDALVGSPGGAQEETVFRLASGVRVDQATEIARMRLILEALPQGHTDR